MTTTTQKMATDKRNALTRIEELERLIPNLLQAIGKQIDAVNNKQNAIDELVNSIIGVVGVDAVSAELLKNREDATNQKIETQKAETERLKAEGVLEPAAVIEADSVILLSESKADGSPVIPGWVRAHVSELKEQFCEELVGKTVGYTGTLENGNVFSVLEVLKVNASKAVANAQKDA